MPWRHDETGVLVPPDDVGALADGMRALIADELKAEIFGGGGPGVGWAVWLGSVGGGFGGGVFAGG